MKPFEVVVLGASGTYPRPGGACSGFLLRCGDYAMVIDAGSGTFGNLQTHTDYRQLQAVILSHLHLDHILDLYSMYYALRYSPDSTGPEGLEVYAPAGAEAHLQQLVSPTAADGFAGYFDFKTIRSGDRLGIVPFVCQFKRSNHPVETLAMRIEVNARSLVYTADTGWSDGLVSFARGANLLIAEASLQEPSASARDVHMTAEEAGRLAHQAAVDRLVLTHIVPGLDPAVSVEQAGRQFGGSITAATDNAVYEV